MPSDVVLVAGIGVVGTLAAACLGFVGTWLADRRRFKREDTRRDDAYRIARRLVRAELGIAGGFLHVALDADNLGTVAGAREREAWEEHAAVLADRLPHNAFYLTAAAYDVIRRIVTSQPYWRSDQEITDGFALIRTGLATTEKAIEGLAEPINA